jgi:hypothetical protein
LEGSFPGQIPDRLVIAEELKGNVIEHSYQAEEDYDTPNLAKPIHAIHVHYELIQ